MNSRVVFLTISLLITLNLSAATIKTIFGDVQEDNPLILKLINSNAIERLKHIDQSGPEAYFTKNYPMFSRYDHSLGVYALLKRYNVTTNEQIAGLMHDASHTVFSHLGDIVFQKGAMRKESYQDNIHNWFLSNMGIEKLISEYDLQLSDISPKHAAFTALEQPYPDMNADRIEYNLHTGLVFNDLDQEDVQKILAALKFENGKWYFTDVTNAKKFATLSTYYTKAIWGHPHNVAVYSATSAVIKYALDKKIITADEMHFGVDQAIVEKLRTSKDPIVQQLLAIIENIESYYESSNPRDYDIHQVIKMRGVDPLVLTNGQMQRLSNISHDFKNELLITKDYTDRGVYIKFKNVPNKAVLALIRKANI